MTTSSIAQARADLEMVRWRLALVWFALCGVIFFLLVAQSIGGVFGDHLQRVWSWALPNFVPTLALMISVFAASAVRQGGSATVWVRRNFYRLAMSMSLFYLLLLLLTILVQPLLHFLPGDAVDVVDRRLALLETSNLWLAPLQGLVVAVLGVLFFLREEPAAVPGASAGGASVPLPQPEPTMAPQIGAGAP